MDKAALLEDFRQLLTERLHALETAQSDARTGTRVDGSHRPSNRGERGAVTAQGYLAAGLQARITELTAALDLLADIGPEPRHRVVTGAWFELEEADGTERQVYVLPGGQGDRLADGTVVLSPQAPLVRALAGAETGDEAEVPRAGTSVTVALLSIR